MKPFILGAIFARGGSKGVPRKNIRLLASDDPILHHPRIFFQPHIGSGDTVTREAMTRLAVENVLDIIEGRRPRSLLNPAVYEGTG